MKLPTISDVQPVSPPIDAKITMDGWPFFSVTVPNGTSLLEVNEFCTAVAEWAWKEHVQRRQFSSRRRENE